VPFVVDPEFWARLLGIVVIDLALAGDNALVIALAVRRLAPREQLWGRVGGTIGAVGLRIAFMGLVTWLLAVPLLRSAAGLALVWIAFRLVRQATEAGPPTKRRPGDSLKEAIGLIIVADAVMSLDNVLAVAATAHGNLPLAAVGVALSLPLVIWGSGLLARLMDRLPAVIWMAGGILGYVGGGLIVEDDTVAGWLGQSPLPAVLPLGLAALVSIRGWRQARRAKAGMIRDDG